MNDFFVYEDWTLESQPRCFYVGKGKRNRVSGRKRNKHHTNIMNKHGLDRRVVMGPVTNIEACRLERSLIAERRTYVHAINYVFGANYTEGGEGRIGPLSEKQKRQIGVRASRENLSDETLEKMRNSHLGRRQTEDTKRKISVAMKGNRTSDIAKRLWQDPEFRAKMLQARKTTQQNGDT